MLADPPQSYRNKPLGLPALLLFGPSAQANKQGAGRQEREGQRTQGTRGGHQSTSVSPRGGLVTGQEREAISGGGGLCEVAVTRGQRGGSCYKKWGSEMDCWPYSVVVSGWFCV